ncbi:Uncharacterised protein [Legionella beliardensis]|uniref:Uncharacterized protein n=1 Tax=Legionella beliardensis TaxID=91822 RepID=A0A378I395_9GAMM|nr:hypothetical protein [Legionella beliardensis]STX29185.1 Uncharacterised protein [Legionella beliardensis]
MLKLILFFLCLSASAFADISSDIQSIKIRVGAPFITLGPAPNIIDNLFNSIRLTNNSYLCFTANSYSYKMTGSDPLCQKSKLTAVIGPIANGYADCGLWINDVLIDSENSNHLLGFAHAETACINSGTHKSMNLVESHDNGKTWSLTGQIITGVDRPTSGKITGEGDANIIPGKDNYNYLYILRNSDYRTIVARALKTTPAGPWYKYYNGNWNSPGLGGNATALKVFGSASVWREKNYVMLLSLPNASEGVRASFSSDYINFTQLLDPLLVSDNSSWDRQPDSTELFAYLSATAMQGGRVWNNGQFIMTYMYLEPGANFSSRYLVKRNVNISSVSSPNTDGSIPQVGVELSRWINPLSNPNEIWTTTAATPGFFKYLGRLGYLMTRKLTGTKAPETVAIEECVSNWTGGVDHVITLDGTCTKAGYTRLRTLGWLYKDNLPNTIALYRCWSPEKYKSHFASTDINCEGETTEFILGYIMMS